MGNHKWKLIAGSAKVVSVAKRDVVYVVNDNDEIYRYVGGAKWIKIAGSLKYISITI